jgi:hypothetical protein
VEQWGVQLGGTTWRRGRGADTACSQLGGDTGPSAVAPSSVRAWWEQGIEDEVDAWAPTTVPGLKSIKLGQKQFKQLNSIFLNPFKFDSFKKDLPILEKIQIKYKFEWFE